MFMYGPVLGRSSMTHYFIGSFVAVVLVFMFVAKRPRYVVHACGIPGIPGIPPVILAPPHADMVVAPLLARHWSVSTLCDGRQFTHCPPPPFSLTHTHTHTHPLTRSFFLSLSLSLIESCAHVFTCAAMM